MTTIKYANNDLVCVGFLKAILNQTGGVGLDLPGDTSWAATGFVQVLTGVGGTSDIYTPQRHPVIGVKCWAQKPGGRKPPWEQANNLAETIRAACQGRYHTPVGVGLPAGYPPVLVHDAYALTDPRRVLGDDSSYAGFQFDLQLHWTPTGRAL